MMCEVVITNRLHQTVTKKYDQLHQLTRGQILNNCKNGKKSNKGKTLKGPWWLRPYCAIIRESRNKYLHSAKKDWEWTLEMKSACFPSRHFFGLYKSPEGVMLTFEIKFLFFWDINECESAWEICHERAHCVNTIGGYLCERSCPDGFTAGLQGDCEDINECTLGLHNCTDGVLCSNVPGLFLSPPRIDLFRSRCF